MQKPRVLTLLDIDVRGTLWSNFFNKTEIKVDDDKMNNVNKNEQKMFHLDSAKNHFFNSYP